MVDNFRNISPGQLRGMPLQGNISMGRQLQHLKKSGDDTAIRKFSQDFEALFVQRMMKEMRKSIPKGGLMDKSLSMEWFEEMFDQAVAKEVTTGEGIGMAQVIYDQLTRSPGGNRAATAGYPQPTPGGVEEISEKTKSASGENPVQTSEEKGVVDDE